jgi:hypothetical protein
MIGGFAPGEQGRGDFERGPLCTADLVEDRAGEPLREPVLVQVDRPEAVEGQALDAAAALTVEGEREVEVVDAVRAPAAGEGGPGPGEDRVNEASDFVRVRRLDAPDLDFQAFTFAPRVRDLSCCLLCAAFVSADC